MSNLIRSIEPGQRREEGLSLSVTEPVELNRAAFLDNSGRGETALHTRREFQFASQNSPAEPGNLTPPTNH